MATICLEALFCALFAGWLVHPLMRAKETRRTGYALLIILPLAALALYLLLGSP